MSWTKLTAGSMASCADLPAMNTRTCHAITSSRPVVPALLAAAVLAHAW